MLGGSLFFVRRGVSPELERGLSSEELEEPFFIFVPFVEVP